VDLLGERPHGDYVSLNGTPDAEELLPNGHGEGHDEQASPEAESASSDAKPDTADDPSDTHEETTASDSGEEEMQPGDRPSGAA
jgi:hypothetical protein